jgi:hypothetical protein
MLLECDDFGAAGFVLLLRIESGIALRLPPHSKDSC